MLTKQTYLLLFVGFILTLALPMNVNGATNSEVNYAANAYGTYVFVGNTATVGKTAVSVLGCVAHPPAHSENTVTSARVLPFINVGLIHTTADAIDAADTESKSISTVNSVNLLLGLIKADVIKAVTTTSLDNIGKFHTSANGSVFTNLIVAGNSISGTPAPNTKIVLPGLGYVMLNEQISQTNATSASLQVNMIHVVINLPNLLGIPTGTQIIVSHASSSLHGFYSGFLYGFSYGSNVNVASIVTSGNSAYQTLPCLGTNNQVLTNSIAGVNLPGGLLTLGQVTDTAKGVVTQTSSTGETTSTIQSTNIAAGTIKADLIKADSHAFTDGTPTQLSDTGTQFLGLVVAGHPEINANVQKNTKIQLAGIGTLWLRREIKTQNYLEIRMIELNVESVNVLNIPVGTNIRVGVAKSGIVK